MRTRKGADRRIAGGLTAHPVALGEDFRDLRADFQHRIERGHRFLKDHPDLTPAQALHFGLGGRDKVGLAIENHRPAKDTPARIVDQPVDRHCRDGFAGPALPDDGDGFAGVKVEADAMNDLRLMSLHPETDGQILDRQKRHGAAPCDLGSKMSRKASPRRLKPNTASMMTMAGKISIQGAISIRLRLSDSISPSDG